MHYVRVAFCLLDYLANIYLQKICKSYVRKTSMSQLQIQFLHLEKNNFSQSSSSFSLLLYVISVLTAVNGSLIKQQCQYTVILKCWIRLSPHGSPHPFNYFPCIHCISIYMNERRLHLGRMEQALLSSAAQREFVSCLIYLTKNIGKTSPAKENPGHSFSKTS